MLSCVVQFFKGGNSGDGFLSLSVLLKYECRVGHCLFSVGLGYDGLLWGCLSG